jgi:hypothetical protein
MYEAENVRIRGNLVLHITRIFMIYTGHALVVGSRLRWAGHMAVMRDKKMHIKFSR